MVAPQNHHELAGNGMGLVHRVAQSPLGDLWLALDQRRGPPGEPVLLRYVSLAGGAQVPGCGDSGVIDCSHVLRSKWSYAYGLPISAFAAIA